MGERKCGSQGNEGLGRGRLDPEDGQVGGEAADEAGAPETMGKPRGNLGLSMGLLTRVAGSKGWPGPPLPGLASAEPPSRPSSESSTLTSSSGSSASPSSSHSSRSRSVRLPWRLVAAEAAAPGLLDLWLAWSSFSVLTWSW